jgi:hypothetical protein
LTRP